MNTNRYFKTFQEGDDRVHLEGIGDSYTLCGMDTAGDDWLYDKDPEDLGVGYQKVTCVQCNDIINIVREHIGP